MKGHGEKLHRKQEQAISALLLHPTLREAADASGVGETTLWRWLRDPDFQRAYRDARRQLVSHAVARIQVATIYAVDALLAVVISDSSTAANRITAARAILDLAIKGVEVEDLSARIEALETQTERKSIMA